MTARRLILDGVPDRRLSPNNRRRMHWASEARLTTQMHDQFHWLMRDHYQGEVSSEPLRMTVTVIWPKGLRTVDIDAIAAMCKPLLDAMQNVVYVNDSQIATITYAQGRDDTGYWPEGCTVIDVEEASNPAAMGVGTVVGISEAEHGRDGAG